MLALLLLLLFIPIILLLIRLLQFKVALLYRVQLMDTHRLTIKLSLLRFPIWSKTFHLMTLEEYLKSETTSTFPVPWKELVPLLKSVKVKHFDWETGVGTGEAALTGNVAGVIWTGKELGIRFLEAETKMLSSPTYRVKPNYYGEGFYSRLDCILFLRFPSLLKLRKLLKS